MIRFAFLLLAILVHGAHAQVVESPVAFDLDGKVRVVTPELVAQLQLTAPGWPVRGDFVSARLYSVGTGGTVLSVERANGDIERHSLDDAALAALRSAVQAGVVGQSVAVAQRPPVAESQARGRFARNSMFLATVVYGPLVASFADDGQTGTALYLLTVGGSFFIVNQLSANTRVTRVQTDLGTDGALRGYAAASGLLYAFGGDDLDRKAYSAIGLVGAISGTTIGFNRARQLTDAEAHSARKLSTLAAAGTIGALGTLGVMGDTTARRPAIAVAVGTGLLGYVFGPAYPRRASYTVTAGDVRLLHIGALLGIGAGFTPVAGDSISDEIKWAGATAGMALGTLLMERTWVRRYDHDHGDASMTWLGTLAGTLMGGAVAVLVETDSPGAVTGLLTGGAFLGMLGGQNAARPAQARPRGAPGGSDEMSESSSRARRRLDVRFDPGALATAAARVPGQHALVSIRF